MFTYEGEAMTEPNMQVLGRLLAVVRLWLGGDDWSCPPQNHLHTQAVVKNPPQTLSSLKLKGVNF